MNTLPAAGRWTADATATTASFEVSNFFVNRVSGTIVVRSGVVATDQQGRPTSVSAVLEAGSIATGHPRRDKDLRARRFLDVETHPRLRFTGTSIQPAADGAWTVDGALGVGTHEAPMRLTVELRPGSRPGTVQVAARGSLDRTDAGIKAPSFLVGRQVQVTVDGVLSLAPASVDA